MVAAIKVKPIQRTDQLDGQGRIIILGSLGGIVPMPHEAVYAATKFAVRGFSLSLGEELRHSGVSVSLIRITSYNVCYTKLCSYNFV